MLSAQWNSWTESDEASKRYFRARESLSSRLAAFLALASRPSLSSLGDLPGIDRRLQLAVTSNLRAGLELCIVHRAAWGW